MPDDDEIVLPFLLHQSIVVLVAEMQDCEEAQSRADVAFTTHQVHINAAKSYLIFAAALN